MSNRNLPEIRIDYSWLLRGNVSEHLNKLWGDGTPLRSEDRYRLIAKKYRNAWEPFADKILNGMCDITGLTFRQNIIDVYIAPWFAAFSDPMVIGVKYEPDVFVDVLTHELLHRLLTDNNSVPSTLRLLPTWEKMFGKNHSFITLVHIPVHAIHEAIYLDVLHDPNRLVRDKVSHQQNKHADYVKAWEYVEKHGYKEIINQLKESYSKMALNK